MGRITGVVMEQEGTHVIVLTSTGEFRRIRCRGTLPDIGEEIAINTKRKSRFIPRIAWVAAAAAVLLMALASPLATFINQPPEKAVAWVTVDINPSLELTISDRDRVMEATALNDDGKKVLANVDVVGKDPETAVADLTGEAAKMGYIGDQKDNSVLISIAGAAEKYNSQKLEGQLLAAAQGTLSEQRMVAVVQTVKVTSEFREQAKKKEISTGKYAVLIEAVNSGYMITEDEIKDHSVTEAIKKAGGQPEVILQKAHEEKVEQLPEKEKKYMMIAGEMKRTNSEDSGVEAGGGKEKTPDAKSATSKEDDKQLLISPIGNRGVEQVKPTTTPTEPKEPTEDPASGNDNLEGKPTQPDIGKDTNPNTDLGNFRERDNSMN